MAKSASPGGANVRETERITLEVKQIPPTRVGSPPLINIISWFTMLCAVSYGCTLKQGWLLHRKKKESSFLFSVKRGRNTARLQPAALGLRLELFDHPRRVSSHQPCFKRHKTRVSTIHKQYTDLINTSPTYLFLSALMLAHEGLKLTCLLKEYIAFFSSPPTRQKQNKWVFIHLQRLKT